MPGRIYEGINGKARRFNYREGHRESYCFSKGGEDNVITTE